MDAILKRRPVIIDSVLELFFYPTLLVATKDVEFNGENYKEVTENIFGKKYVERLYKMFDATCSLLKPNGKCLK